MENAAPNGQQTPVPANSGNQGANPPQQQQKTPDVPDFRGTKHKIKANGQELELSYEDLVLRATKAEGAEKNLQEAARLRREAEERTKRRKDPNTSPEVLLKELMEEIGEDRFYELSEEAVWKRMNYEKLSPAERRAIEAEDKAARLEREKEERESGEKKSRSEALLQDSVKRIDRLITDAIAEAKASGIIAADLPEAMELMLDEYMAHLEYLADLESQGYDIPKEELSHKAVLEKIQGRYNERTQGYIGKLSAAELRKILTPEQIAALRKEEVSQLHGGHGLNSRSQPVQQKQESIFSEKRAPSDQRRMSSKEAFDRMDEKILGTKRGK